MRCVDLNNHPSLNAIEEVDDDHSTEDETRFYRIGLSGTRLVYVVFTIVDAEAL